MTPLRLTVFVIACAVIGFGAPIGAADDPAARLPDDRRRPGPDLSQRPGLGITVTSCGSHPEDGEGQVIAELVDEGMDFYAFRAEWRHLEDPDTLDLIRWAIPWAKDLGLDVMLTIPTIDTAKRTIPADLEHLEMDNPTMVQRFAAVLEAVLTEEVRESLDYLAVGNEVDLYLSGHPEEAQPFAVFAHNAYTTARQLGFTGQSCVAITHFGLLNNPEGAISNLTCDCDFLPITYYPQVGGFRFAHPSVVDADIAAIVAAAGNLPVVFQEVGYPSSPANNGSHERQRLFLENVLKAVTDHGAAIKAVNVDWYCDAPRAELALLAAELYDMTPEHPDFEAFMGFIGSLGLRDEDGTEKPAYSTFLAALRTSR